MHALALIAISVDEDANSVPGAGRISPVGGLGRMRLRDFFSEKCTEKLSSQSGSFLTSVVHISPPPLFIGGQLSSQKKKEIKQKYRMLKLPSPTALGLGIGSQCRQKRLGGVKSKCLRFLPPPELLSPFPLRPHQNKVVFSK